MVAQLFLWPEDSRLVVADIEGMILQSSKGLSTASASGHVADGAGGVTGRTMKSAWGSLFFSFGSGGEVAPGVAATDATQLLNDIAKNGYHIVYIATKSVTQSSSTKIELVKATEKSSSRLPPGPVFLSPDTLVRTLDSERPDLFKAAVLRGTRSLFPSSHNPFYSGFCTHETDMQAFLRCGFPEGRTFLATGNTEIKIVNRTTKWTYRDMHSFLHEVFPSYYDRHRSGGNAYQRKISGVTTTTAEDAYNDFNFWKIPPAIIQ